MIKISVKGLAKFMTASPAGQRKILRDFKFPDEDEPKAMRLYYGEATDAIKSLHRNGHERQWLLNQADLLNALGGSLGGQSAVRLRNNARGLRHYADNFANRRFTVLPDVRLELVYGDVRITVVPDLHVREGSKEKIVKLDFAKQAPSDEVVKIISQSMFEAVRATNGATTPSSVLYFDVPRGVENRGARVGARLAADIRAACDNIAALWDGIAR